jgi:asparagine synthase (glutamine-hydrolysing)
MKTRNGNLKHILKKSVRGLIPDELIDRKKQGFGVPIHEWFMDQLGERTQKELKSFCDETDFIDYPEVQRLIKDRQSPMVWHILNLALWWKKYIN